MIKSRFTYQRMQTIRPLVAILLASTFALLSNPGQAAEKIWHNTDQPVFLKSKRILVDQKSGDIIYRGNVRVKQGNLVIMAAKAKTSSSGNQPNHIWASGNPVEIHKINNGELVVLTATNAHYDLKTGLITLSGNVKLKMGSDTLNSKNLIYNVKTNTITVYTKDAPLSASFSPERIKKLQK